MDDTGRMYIFETSLVIKSVMTIEGSDGGG